MNNKSYETKMKLEPVILVLRVLWILSGKTAHTWDRDLRHGWPSKNRGGLPPKMDGENNEKPMNKRMIWGYPLFLETSTWKSGTAGTWWIIPVSSRSVFKPFRPFGRGITPGDLRSP